ncbi:MULTISPECIES: hypothetical protein [unclassified Microbulbifer]|uniref:hypothetical protein n=1 Tax=unclassified Microbulbifer TaxID=2619833 RepID=UPI0027E5B435|nr:MULTISPECIES: hypothetical protein [unclassified Microbulbifer]
MTTYDHDADLFRLVGTVVAASQIFEAIFVLATKLAVRQADIQVLENIEPLPEFFYSLVRLPRRNDGKINKW